MGCAQGDRQARLLPESVPDGTNRGGAPGRTCLAAASASWMLESMYRSDEPL